MRARTKGRRPVVRSILVTLLAQVATCVMLFLSGAFMGAYALPRLSPYILGSLSLFVPIVTGACWFRFKINRVMTHPERLVFATGVALMNAVLTIGINFALAWFGVSLSRTIVASLMLVMLLAFVAAYFLAWLLTLRPSSQAA